MPQQHGANGRRAGAGRAGQVVELSASQEGVTLRAAPAGGAPDGASPSAARAGAGAGAGAAAEHAGRPGGGPRLPARRAASEVRPCPAAKLG